MVLTPWKVQKTTHSWRKRHTLTFLSPYIESMVTQLRMRSLLRRMSSKIVNVCYQYRGNVLNTVIPDTVAYFSEYNFVTLK